MKVIRTTENPFSFTPSGNALVKPIFERISPTPTPAPNKCAQYKIQSSQKKLTSNGIFNPTIQVVYTPCDGSIASPIVQLLSTGIPTGDGSTEYAAYVCSTTPPVLYNTNVSVSPPNFNTAQCSPPPTPTPSPTPVVKTTLFTEVSPINAGRVTVSGEIEGSQNRIVTATAIANSGFRFVKWSITKAGQVLPQEPESATVDFVMDTNITARAIFEAVIQPSITSKIDPNVIEVKKPTTGIASAFTKLFVNKNFDATLTARVISSLPQGVSISVGNVARITDSTRAAQLASTDEAPVQISVNYLTPDSFAPITEYPLEIETESSTGLVTKATFILRIVSEPTAPIPGIGIFGTNVEVLKGSSVSSPLTIFRQNFTEPVNITLSATLPTGVIALVEPNNTVSTQSFIRFSTNQSTPVGKYAVTVTATAQVKGETLTATDVVYLTVREEVLPPQNPTLQVGISPATGGNLSVSYTNAQGSKVTETFTTTRNITVKLGTTVTAVAKAATGFNFVRWTNDSNFIATATSGADITGTVSNNAVLTAIFTEVINPPPPKPQWRSCVDGQMRDGTPPAEYKQSIYSGAGGGVCWEPPARVTFEPPMATALNFLYRRGTSEYPTAKTIKATNPSYARSFRVKLTTNNNIKLAIGANGGNGTLTFTIPPRGSVDFTVLLTPALYEVLGDGNSVLSLNVEVTEV